MYTMYVTGIFKYISQRCFAVQMNYTLPKYNNAAMEYKQELFASLSDDKKEELTILEVGAGSGGNLNFYPKNIPIKVIAVEPNVHFQKYLQRNLARHENISLDRYLVCPAENMKEVESNSLEIVISTIVMCSVQTQSAVLSEIKRVLKPGGKFYFMEHVAGEPGTWLFHLQNLLNTIWGLLFDGCNLNRNTSVAIDNAGFAQVKYKRLMVEKLGAIFYVVQPHIAGYAVK